MSVPFGQIALAVGAVAVGSLFASADAALNGLPEARLQNLLEDKGAEPGFERFAADRLAVLSRWLVARVTAIAIGGVLFTRSAEELMAPLPAGITAAVATVLFYGSFTEVLSTIARRQPSWVGRAALRWLYPLEILMLPVAGPLAAVGRFVMSRMKEEAASDARLTATEVEWLVDQGEKAGALEKEPATMIRNVLDFKDLTAKEVMIPRRRISAIEISTELGDVLDLVAKDHHSRYPVYREALDNVVGLLYVKDLFEVVRSGKLTATKLDDLVRKPGLFVTETQPALNVLREMRVKRMHLALVSDEFGGTSGLVTLEDIIEEIVGDINDEYDTEELQITKLAEGRFVADAAIPLDALEHHLGQKLPEDGDFESLGGLIVHHAGRVPAVGATVSLEGYELIVREADETHVVKVEIVRAEPGLTPPPENPSP